MLYKFRFNVVDISNEANVFNQPHTLTLHLYIDNTEITNQKAQISSYTYNHGHYFTYSAIIDVGSVESDDVDAGKYANWSSSKVITLKAANSHADYPARLFSIKTVSSGAYVHTFVPPTNVILAELIVQVLLFLLTVTCVPPFIVILFCLLLSKLDISVFISDIST